MNKGTQLTASQPVSVYAFNYLQQASAAFACYPTPLLGTRYCLMARPSYLATEYASDFDIVATADNTTATITPSPTAHLGNNLSNKVKGSVPTIDRFEEILQVCGEARKLRVEYAGAIYHVLNRGDRREPSLTLKWIAKRLQMGNWKHLNGWLYEQRKSK